MTIKTKATPMEIKHGSIIPGKSAYEKIGEYTTVGAKVAEISKALNRNYKTVYDYISRTQKKGKPATAKFTKPTVRIDRRSISPSQDKEIANRYLAGESYPSIAKSMGINYVSCKGHGLNYINTHGLSKAVTVKEPILQTRQKPDMKKCYERFKKFLKYSDNIPLFVKQEGITQSTTRPRKQTVYYWFNQITGVKYTDYKNGAGKISKPKPQITNIKTIVAPQETQSKAEPSAVSKEIKKLEKRIRELKENKRLKEN